MLRAVKLWKSSSISGPSATVKPISPKMATISSMVWLTGWMRPSASGRGGRVTSTRSLGEARVQRGPGEVRLARVEGGGDRLLQGVQALAGLAPLLGAEPAEGLHELGDLALLAQGLDPDLLQILQRGCGLGRPQPLVPDLVQLLHDLPNPQKEKGRLMRPLRSSRLARASSG